MTVLVLSRNCLKSERNLSPFGELTVPARGEEVTAAIPKSVPSWGGGRAMFSLRGSSGAEQADPPLPSWGHLGIPPGSLQQSSSASQSRACLGEIRGQMPSLCTQSQAPRAVGQHCRAGPTGALGRGQGCPAPAGSKDSVLLCVSLSSPAAPGSQKEVTLSHVAQV